MKMLIAGQAKSGTTALYYTLKKSLPGNCKCMFEPRRYVERKSTRSVLAKVLIDGSARIDDFSHFDKKILMVRDPRDNLISRLMYAIYNTRSVALDSNKADVYLNCIERKRSEPSSISVLEILELLCQLAGEDSRDVGAAGVRCGYEFGISHPDYFVFKYEDFVAGKTSELEEYLGICLTPDRSVDSIHTRVVRTKSSGDWKNWFTEGDVAYFRGVFEQYLIKYRYDTDWQISRHPQILPEHSTEYLRQLIKERRSLHGARWVIRHSWRIITEWIKRYVRINGNVA